MCININNYEEYFLLYIDGELNDVETREVEKFLEDHPELEEELDLLKSTISPVTLPSGTLSFSLLRLPSGLTAEEAMILEIDGEISPIQLEELNQLCKEFPFLMEERKQMLELKLDKTEILPFKDKAELYRHERRVISIRLWRSAIAAAIIGIGLFFGLNETYRPDESELVGIQENGAPANHPAIVESVPLKPADSLLSDEETEPVKSSVEGSQPENTRTASIDPVSKAVAEHKFSKDLAEKSSNIRMNTPAVLENINIVPGNFSVSPTVSPIERTKVNMVPPDEVREEVEKLTASKPLDADLSLVTNDNAKVTAAETSSIGHISVIGEEKVNRSKFAGFVNKVKRSIEKKTNIKMPELRLAGYEIAIK